MAKAWAEFGQREQAGAAHNPRIAALFREVGHEEIKADEVAWCAAFVGACLERAGFTSTRSLLARSYAEWGDALANERVGAIAVLSRGADEGQGHVGFVAGWTAERLFLIGGNQGDAVSVAGFSRSRLLSLRWPQGQAADDVFAAALAHVLKMEGGFTDDPLDPGGPTHKGITLKTLAAWRGVKLTAANRDELIAELRRISDEEARAIYAKRYWQPAGCAGLPPPLAVFHFDAAVNHGVGGAVRMLQEAVGAYADGEIGRETKGRIAAMPMMRIIKAYAEIRRRRYRALPHFWRFGRGWLTRVERTVEAAEKLRTEEVSMSAGKRTGETTMSEKQAQGVEPKWWGQSMTIWGVLISAAASVLPVVGPVLGLDVTGDLVRQVGDEVVAVGQALTVLVGTLMAIYGRAQAKRPLSLLRSRG